MKKLLAIVLSLALLVCAAACAETVKRVPGVDMEAEDSLKDCMVKVSFSSEMMDETSVYSLIWDEIRYDIAEIGQLKVGDTIETSEGDVTIETLTKEDGVIEINGGYDNGGVTLWSVDEDNCWVEKDMEMNAIVAVGQAQLTFADIVAISIYNMNEDLSPTGEGYDTIVVPAAKAAAELTRIAEMMGIEEFSPYSTTATMENGVLTGITIDYIA